VFIGRSHNFQKFWESKLRRFAGQLAHEFQSGKLVPPALNQHIEDFAFRVWRCSPPAESSTPAARALSIR
jgi:hypothetical protein